MRSPRSFLFGSAWNPLSWPRERQLRDLDAMAEAGLNHVRLAGSAWASLEPSPGRFDFDWLDGAIRAAHARGLATILSVPTASLPPWLLRAHPDLLLEGSDAPCCGHRGRPGIGIHHPAYLEATARLITAMAHAFGPREEVAGWQLEPAPCDHALARDTSGHAEAAYRSWLQARYGDLAALNQAWSGTSGAGSLTDWEEVGQVWTGRAGVSPQAHLDRMRFGRWAGQDDLERQAGLIRAHARPGQELFAGGIALPAKTGTPGPAAAHAPACPGNCTDDTLQQTLAADLAFAVTGAPYVVVEMPCGCACQSGPAEVPPLAAGGALRFQFWKHAINQARGLSTWRWDRAPAGPDMDHRGVIHWNGRRTRAWAEYECFARELVPVEDTVLANRKRTRVALLHDADSHLLATCHGSNRQPHRGRFHDLAGAFHRRGENVAFLRWDQSWAEVALVIASGQVILDEANAEHLRRWVAGGGVFIALAGFGTLDRCGKGHTSEEAPAFLCEVFGARWDEADESATGAAVLVRLQWPSRARIEFDAVGPIHLVAVDAESTATAAGRLQTGWLAGETVVSSHAYGQGKAVLWGLPIEPRLLDAAVLQWTALAGFRAGDLTGLADPGPLAEGVEIIPGTHFTAYLNPSRTDRVAIRLAAEATDLLSGQRAGTFTIPPLGIILAGGA